MTRKARNNIHIEQFTSYQTFLKACDGRAVNSWEYENRARNADWAGDTYKDARRMLEYGDAAMCKSITPTVTQQAASIKPIRRKDVCGYAPIVPAAIIGLPKTMRRKVKTLTRSKVVTLVIDITGAAAVDADEFTKAGRDLCAFIQGAELAGYRIGIDVMAVFQDGTSKDGYAVRVTIKRPEQPLDIKRVAYPLTHASMFRQLMFDWYERFPDARDVPWHGHAIRYDDEKTRERTLAQILKPNEHYCGLLDGNFAAALK